MNCQYFTYSCFATYLPSQQHVDLAHDFARPAQFGDEGLLQIGRKSDLEHLVHRLQSSHFEKTKEKLTKEAEEIQVLEKEMILDEPAIVYSDSDSYQDYLGDKEEGCVVTALNAILYPLGMSSAQMKDCGHNS